MEILIYDTNKEANLTEMIDTLFYT